MSTSLPVPALRRALPPIIQGGMGVAVSSWRLASAVARRGQLGVVSGTALDLVLARRLEDGDLDGSVRRAMAAFPVRAIVERVLARYLRPGGRAPGVAYTPVPRLSIRPGRAVQELTVLGNFVEVWLAKAGHSGPVGINYLEKVQMALPAAAYGAMLAGVDAVLVGAGIPRHLPHLLDALAAHRPTRLPVDVAGDPGGDHAVTIDPPDLLGPGLPPLERPMFLAIVSSEVLAAYLTRDPAIRPDGFVVEGPRAGGHNAPPRGRPVRDERGQPVFGARDQADIGKVAAVGLPFWLAGSLGTPEAVRAAVATGATGVQVGTVFALSADSGLTPELRARLLARLRAGTLEVLTDGDASPTGFPFKVAQLEGSLSDPAVRAARPRLCDLGYLRSPYRKDDGRVGYRCPAEPVEMFVRKGGSADDAAGRACLCNALSADVGLGQTRPDGRTEEALVTLGADLSGAGRLAELYPDGWSADQVVDWLLSRAPA
ncbi:nitronate monooxygenase [Cellulomonas humilata]|uniref:NAD(P)H-dependent flavin oxidoreductase YrpB (Nitropropane dioxygenase family) n=1 Tax=Cellulomonas humilata TaxID=144055 RepID=A0ABU0EFF0_9CELL|nr:nitronate monooxygenase [Cellulomonas humilata]MDQ0373959.1 NAD(P)H-dependent flavin oxidoreductase YrpB (nitropropane dioxygenase family) [Cellulomonas humilata]